MNNEENVEAAKKDAGGDEKLIIKFAWPYSNNSLSNSQFSLHVVLCEFLAIACILCWVK